MTYFHNCLWRVSGWNEFLNSASHLIMLNPPVSPMLVDSSLHSQSEDASAFGTDVINVTEYAEEIHQYLREAEVSLPKFCFNFQDPKHLIR